MQIFRPYRLLGVLVLTFAVLFAAIHAAQADSISSEASAPAYQAEDPIVPEGANPDANCRYGVAVRNDHIPYLDTLGAGWYLNFGVSAPDATNGAEFTPIIRVKQDKDGANYLSTFTVTPPLTDQGLGARIDNNPGAIWIVGNEIDRGPDPDDPANRVQDDTYPDVYAEAYHDVYHFIKQRDPSALVANSALVQVTPGRIQYLDMMYDAYVSKFGTHMPVDVWNMHVYVLPEVDPSTGQPNGVANVALGTDLSLGILGSYDPDGGGPLGVQDSCSLANVYCYAEHDSMQAFQEQIVRMRQWMHSRGYQNSPLILSEYSLLFPYQWPDGSIFTDEFGNAFTPTRVQTFMQQSFDYLSTAVDPTIGFPADNNRLVQQWLWFHMYVEATGHVSNLLENETSGTLTNLGQEFRNTVASEPSYVNLYPARVNSPYASTDASGTGDVTLVAEVGNNGTATAGTFDVVFYSNSGLTNEIGRATVPAKSSAFPGMTGCGVRTVSVSVPWNDLAPGEYNYWVKVDGGDAIGEDPPNQDGEADNVRRGTVFIDSVRMFLPAVSNK